MMKSGKKFPLKDYIAGGVVANALAWLTLGVSAFSEINPFTLGYLLVIMYLVGSLFGGYLVGRKMKQDYLKNGLLTGVFSFVVHVYVLVGLLWIFTGSEELSLQEHLMIFSVLLLGSCLGAFLSKLIVSGRYVPPKEAS
jgi:putative membrane protein (TIGR04086 family)